MSDRELDQALVERAQQGRQACFRVAGNQIPAQVGAAIVAHGA